MSLRKLACTMTAAAAACATAPRDGGIQDVRASVAERARLEWDAPTLDTGAPLTATTAVTLALARSPRLKAELEVLGMQRAELLAATAVQNPKVEVEVRFPTDGDLAVIETSLTQSLTDLLYRGRRASAGRAELEAAKLDAASNVLGFVLEVRRAFYRHQADLQRLDLLRTAAEAAGASYEMAKSVHAAGNVNDLELYAERDLLEHALLELAEAEAAAAASREALTAELGLSGQDAAWTARPRLTDPHGGFDPAALEKRAVEQSLALTALRHRLGAAADKLSLAEWSGAIPDVEVGVAAHREEREVWEIGPRLEIALPLFDQGRGAVAAAESEQRKLQRELEDKAVRVRAAARTVAARLTAAEQRARRYREVVLPLKERIFRETEKLQNAMHANVFQLVEAKKQQIEAAKSYVDALEEYWSSRAELEQLLAGGALERSE